MTEVIKEKEFIVAERRLLKTIMVLVTAALELHSA